MGRVGFFDANYPPTALSAKGASPEAIDRLVTWESFSGDLNARC